MWKRVTVLAVILVMVLAVTAAAATPRAVTVVPTLSYEGTTATCEVTVVGNTTNETLNATIKLMHGDEMVRTWYPFGVGILDFEETVEVTRGETYTLMVKVYADTGTSPWFSISGECE